MKRIPVHRSGQVVAFALVDDSDEVLVAGYRWRLHEHGYAMTEVGGRATRRKVYMHRLITNAPTGVGVDHKNRDPLDNQRSNLRLATQAQNCQNVPARGGKSRYRGVFQRKGRSTWFAQVKVAGRQHHLGTFATEEQAAAAAAAFRAEHMPFSTDFVREQRESLKEAA